MANAYFGVLPKLLNFKAKIEITFDRIERREYKMRLCLQSRVCIQFSNVPTVFMRLVVSEAPSLHLMHFTKVGFKAITKERRRFS